MGKHKEIYTDPDLYVRFLTHAPEMPESWPLYNNSKKEWPHENTISWRIYYAKRMVEIAKEAILKVESK